MRERVEFSISKLSFLDRGGRLDTSGLAESMLSIEWLTAAYEAMTLVRVFDRRAVALQRTGQLGTYASALGQEAIGVAIGMTMANDDVLIPYYRDCGAQYLRGVRLAELLTYWGGDERGSDFQSESAHQDLPICVPVATQATHAAGVAAAFKLRAEKRVAVTTCGDGATSKGDFLEAVNLAGAWHLPLVFVVNNNQWAISVPRHLQSGAPTLAQKGIAAGIASLQVDGNDSIALRVAMEEALERARTNKGATLVEAVSYRLSDHTTADDASRYRDDQALDDAWTAEPLERHRTYLVGVGAWDEEREDALIARCEEEVAAAVEHYLAMPPQETAALFDYNYAQLPSSLREQRRHVAMKARRRTEGDGRA